MDRKTRFFGSCLKSINEAQEVELLLEDFVMTLLLFDTYILDSYGLIEFPKLISCFGFEQVKELLRSPAIKIKCSATQTVIHGDTTELIKMGKEFTYPFSIIHDAEPKDRDEPSNISLCFKNLERNISLSVKDFKRLKHLIAEKLDRSIEGPLNANSPEIKALNCLLKELTKDETKVKKMVLTEIRKSYRTEVYDDFYLKLHLEEGSTLRADTNIEKKFNLSKYEAHNLIRQCLLQIASIYDQLANMERYSAICNFNDKDFSVFDGRLEFLAQEHDPKIQMEKCRRILTIGDFPDFSTLVEERSVKLDKILEIRENVNCKQFREWLTNINMTDAATEEEIKEQINSFRVGLGNRLESKYGKIFRFVVSNIIGLLCGTATGVVISSLDNLVLEKIFPSHGPISFINHSIPSIVDKAVLKGEGFVKNKQLASK